MSWLVNLSAGLIIIVNSLIGGIFGVPTSNVGPITATAVQQQTESINNTLDLSASSSNPKNITAASKDTGPVTHQVVVTPPASKLVADLTVYTYIPDASSQVPSFTFQFPASFGKPEVMANNIGGVNIYFGYASSTQVISPPKNPFTLADYTLLMHLGVLPPAQPAGTYGQFIMSLFPSSIKLSISNHEAYKTIAPAGVAPADESAYSIVLKDGSILTIGTKGAEKYMTDKDVAGNATRDKIIESIQFASPQI